MSYDRIVRLANMGESSSPRYKYLRVILMTENYEDYTETNTTAKKGMDKSIEKFFLGYIDKITDKLVHGWVCNSK